jgi:hypothetical protein
VFMNLDGVGMRIDGMMYTQIARHYLYIWLLINNGKGFLRRGKCIFVCVYLDL